MCPRNTASPADTVPAGAHAPATQSTDTDVPICLDFLKGRCTRAQCRFLHPDLAQYEQLSGAVHARAGRRVCEVWAMTGQCKFGAKCSRLHPSVVVGAQPQQVLTLMLPLSITPPAMPVANAETSTPTFPMQERSYPPTVSMQPPANLHPVGRLVTIRPPGPSSPAATFWPPTPAIPAPVISAAPQPATSATTLAAVKPRPVRPAAGGPPPTPRHVSLPDTAEASELGIQDLARSILQSVANGRRSHPCQPEAHLSQPTSQRLPRAPAAIVEHGRSLPVSFPERPGAAPERLPDPQDLWEQALLGHALRRWQPAGF